MTAGAQFGIIKNRKFFTPDAEQKEDVTMGELTNEKKIEEAFYKLIEETFPLLDSEEARESFLGQLDRLAQWVRVMPRTLDPEKKWSREQFQAAMAGLEERKDPHFGAYMDAFYEEYLENPEDVLQNFYKGMFQGEELENVDFSSVWEAVRAGYEDWLKNEGVVDEFLAGEPGREPKG